MHGTSKQVLELPYLGNAAKPRAERAIAAGIRGGTFRDDKFDALKIDDGLVKVGPLPAGDYDLLFKSSGARVLLRVTDGAVRDGYVPWPGPPVGDQGHPSRCSVAGVDTTETDVKIRIANASKLRACMWSPRGSCPPVTASTILARSAARARSCTAMPRAQSVYLSGRNIGDEYRYILDRKYAQKYPRQHAGAAAACCSTRGRFAPRKPASKMRAGGR